ncbi:hypothetical protein Gasu2_17770 [Galdieria sulphuraria]|uniref:RING-type domain-containing protein n=1 Tax=Galdieria sulphuraria TaxID=130081 RepID=M2WUQ6_GALSU|nr:uncharacterized protein Gasu_48310 [Galdieria sulphuraria]EME27690.1 hypothetical protein Gasu_48310 [Galdieria sulphuraria]GJD07415.1 hypothetical protein Gasu2_17770 [Galdieria sulphuraria]|eukprot:XP_005704210.1 hypothetical protein Gasu_48310 [Galdieria sulphuraria]
MLLTRKRLFIGLGAFFLLGALAGAAYWMTISWIKIRDSTQYWTETSCTVLNTSIEQSGTLYRPVVEVNISGNIEYAYQTKSASFLDTKQEAQSYISQFSIGSSYNCYFNPANISQVVTEQEGIPAVDTAGAAIGTALVVIILMTFGFGLCYLDKRRILPNHPNLFMYTMDADRAMNRGIDSENGASHPLRRPNNPAFTLSKQQIEYVCNLCQFSPDLLVSQAVCAICLEELCSSRSTNSFVECEEEKSRQKGLLKLNCGHVYHTACMQRWMIRGGIHCPLCHWNIWSLFGNVDNSQQETTNN